MITEAKILAEAICSHQRTGLIFPYKAMFDKFPEHVFHLTLSDVRELDI